jgi:FixJ family two-component response regulator
LVVLERDLGSRRALGESQPGVESMSEAQPIVFVVDDDVSVRDAIASLVRSVRIDVQCFASAQEYLNGEPLDRPACMVLDVRLPGRSGLELQRKMREDHFAIPIVFLTAYGDVPMTVAAMKEGAIEFLIKPCRDQDLLDAIQQGLERSRAERREQRELAELRERFDSLTPRERQVMAEVVAGLPNKKIAVGLGTTEATIKLHRGQVMQKMKSASLPDLVRIAARLAIPGAPS